MTFFRGIKVHADPRQMLPASAADCRASPGNSMEVPAFRNLPFGVDFPPTTALIFTCLAKDGTGVGSCYDGTPVSQPPGHILGGTSTTTEIYSVRDRSGATHQIGMESSSNPVPFVTTAPDGSGWTPQNALPPTYYTDRNGLKYTVINIPGSQSGTSIGQAVNVEDLNGNSITTSANGWSDSIGRVIPGSYSGPGNGYNENGSPVEFDPFPGIQTSDLSSCPSGTVAARIWQIPSMGSNVETYYLCYGSQQLSTNFNVTSVGGGSISTTEANTTVYMMNALVLPNETSYSFQYDSYGDLSKITLPTGGSISYSWETIPWDKASTSQPVTRVVQSRTVNALDGPSGTWTYSWIARSNPPATGLPGAVNLNVNVTKPDGNDEYYSFNNNSATSSINTSPYTVGTSTVTYYSGHSPANPAGGSGTVLRKKTTTRELIWSPFIEPRPMFPPNSSLFPYVEPNTYPSPPQEWEFQSTLPGPLLSETVTYENGATSQITYTPITSGTISFQDPGDNVQTIDSSVAGTCYCSQYGEYSAIATYDIGAASSSTPGSLLRSEHYTYLWNSGASNAQTYLSANLLDLPYSTITDDANGNGAAEADYKYDESNGSPSGARGNLTSITRVNANGANSTTHTVYSTYGEPTTEIDANGNQTYVSAFQCSGLFPQTVVSPYNSPTTHAETRTYTYDCNTGNLTSYIDPNQNTTTYAYNDPLARLTGITYPTGGGSLSECYSDAPSSSCYSSLPLSITETRATGKSSGALTKKTLYDGLARIAQTQVTSDPQGTDFTNTIYDGLGRVYQQSNPTRCSSSAGSLPGSCTESTWGVTTYTYDALGRKVAQQQPSGGALTWCYDGVASSMPSGVTDTCNSHIGSSTPEAWVDSTDENGNDWQRTNNVLGNLIEVVEPSGTSQTPSMETDYIYDALNNLTSVTQQGATGGSTTARSRGFSYDSLSRLLTASNPETGTICYGSWSGGTVGSGTCQNGYDANGNLQYKTDARGVKISYTYDALNRLLSKSYSDGKTPISCYQYDSSSVTNGIGRLANSWTQPAGTTCGSSPVAGSYLSLRSILAYDTMGRITSAQQQQCIGSKCSAPSPYALNMAYDLAGNMTQLTNSVGAQGSPLTLTNYFDAAARPCSTTSSWSAGFSPNLFQTNPSPQSPGYWPFGGLRNWYLGSNSSSASTGCDTSPSSQVNLQRGFDQRLRVTSFSSTGQEP